MIYNPNETKILEDHENFQLGLKFKTVKQNNVSESVLIFMHQYETVPATHAKWCVAANMIPTINQPGSRLTLSECILVCIVPQKSLSTLPTVSVHQAKLKQKTQLSLG